MFVFGIDVPLVEVVLAFTLISIIILIELIVLAIIQIYQMKQNKRMMRNSLEVAKVLLELKDRELRLRRLKK
ncbi:MAG: hypothetical protein KAT77_04265 [Nanoarchaeota archaeon]|nr:hypothetical protein [Nanoarchaeota archaeon]